MRMSSRTIESSITPFAADVFASKPLRVVQVPDIRAADRLVNASAERWQRLLSAYFSEALAYEQLENRYWDFL